SCASPRLRSLRGSMPQGSRGDCREARWRSLRPGGDARMVEDQESGVQPSPGSARAFRTLIKTSYPLSQKFIRGIADSLNLWACLGQTGLHPGCLFFELAQRSEILLR